MSASRVRGVTAARIASTTSSGWRIGSGIETRTTRGPRALGDGLERVERRVVLVVVREQLVAGPEPQRCEHRRDAGRRVRDDDEALGIGVEERARPSRRAASRRPSSSRVRNRIGLASSSASSARWASRTGRGQAPYVPWVR